MAKILIPTPLRPYTDKQDAVDASGATVGELLADLTRRHSGLKAHLFNDQGKLRSFVNVYVNDEDIRYLQKEQTPVTAGDTVSIIPSVAGGVDTVEDVRRSGLGRMIQISEGAARKIRTLMAKQGIDDGGLRVGVKGGGCSGLSYTFAWERQARLGDEIFEGPEGAKIFVDKKSLLFLDGTVLDYDTNLITKGFVFNNPNAKSTCGCGSSFGA